jgi:hypothetical protein
MLSRRFRTFLSRTVKVAINERLKFAVGHFRYEPFRHTVYCLSKRCSNREKLRSKSFASALILNDSSCGNTS